MSASINKTNTKANPLGSVLRIGYLLSQSILLPLAAFEIHQTGVTPSWSLVLILGFYFFGLLWAMIYLLLFTTTFPAKKQEAIFAGVIPGIALFITAASPTISFPRAAYLVFFTSMMVLMIVLLGMLFFILTHPSSFPFKNLITPMVVGIGITFVLGILFLYSMRLPFLQTLASEKNILLPLLTWLAQIVTQTRSLWMFLRGKITKNTPVLSMGYPMHLLTILLTLFSVLAAFFAFAL